MHFRQLQYFVALAQHQSYGRAADAVGITQPALTQSMAKLEKDLGVQLFVRDRHGTRLTPYGRLLLERARVIVADTTALLLEMRDPHGDARARVNVGVGKSILGPFLPNLVDWFARTHGEAVLHLTEGWSPEMYEMLLEGRLDLVVSCPLPDVVAPVELRQEWLFSQTEAVLLGPENRLFSRSQVSLEELAEEYWLLPPGGNRRLHYIRQVFERAGVEPPHRIVRSDSGHLGPSLIRRGFVAHGLLEVVCAQLEPSEYRVLDIPELTFVRRVLLTTRAKHRLPEPAAAFARAIRSSAAELRGGGDEGPAARAELASRPESSSK